MNDNSTGPPTDGDSSSEREPGEFQQKLSQYLRAGYPLLYVVTPEEDRAIQLTVDALRHGELSRRKLFVWSVSRGLCTADMKSVNRETAEPTHILPFLLKHKDPAVFILEDFHFFLDDRAPKAPLIIRQLRDLVSPFKSSRKTVVILSSVLKLPPELEKDITVVDLNMPDDEELADVLNETIEQVEDNPRVEINLDGNGKEKVVRSLTGLTRNEAENSLAKVIVSRSRLDVEDVDLLLAEKEQIIRKTGMLEFYSTPERFGSIGGLDNLKKWLRERGQAFSEKARAFGLPHPKGLLLVGIPGCGKSLSAKAVSAEWQMPLLKFDLGKVFGQYVGQSEEKHATRFENG